MSRAWLAWYPGDYLRDTAHLNTEQHGAYLLLLWHCFTKGGLPPSEGERAAIAKLTLARWRKHAPIINPFFEADGTHKRITAEIEKADRVALKRRGYGHKGGVASATARAIKRAANGQATAKEMLEQKHTQTKHLVEQKVEQTDSKSEHNHNHKESSLKGETPIENAGSLASALRTGALASQLEPEAPPPLPHKRPNETSLEELNTILANRRKTA